VDILFVNQRWLGAQAFGAAPANSPSRWSSPCLYTDESRGVEDGIALSQLGIVFPCWSPSIIGGQGRPGGRDFHCLAAYSHRLPPLLLSSVQ